MADDLRKPVVLFHPIALYKIQSWVKEASGEVSGYGLVIPHPEGFWIQDVYLPEQDCGGASTEIEPQAVADILMECTDKGVDTTKLKYWWHSHADMSVYWSGTDEDTIKDWVTGDYVISSVFNKKGEVKHRVDLKTPFPLTVENLIHKMHFDDPDLYNECAAQVKEKVKNKTYASSSYHNGWYYNKREKTFVIDPSYDKEDYNIKQMNRLEVKDKIDKLINEEYEEGDFKSIGLVEDLDRLNAFLHIASPYSSVQDLFYNLKVEDFSYDEQEAIRYYFKDKLSYMDMHNLFPDLFPTILDDDESLAPEWRNVRDDWQELFEVSSIEEPEEEVPLIEEEELPPPIEG